MAKKERQVCGTKNFRRLWRRVFTENIKKNNFLKKEKPQRRFLCFFKKRGFLKKTKRKQTAGFAQHGVSLTLE